MLSPMVIGPKKLFLVITPVPYSGDDIALVHIDASKFFKRYFQFKKILRKSTIFWSYLPVSKNGHDAFDDPRELLASHRIIVLSFDLKLSVEFTS